MKDITIPVQQLIDTLIQIKNTLQLMHTLEDKKYDALREVDLITLSNINEEEDVLIVKMESIEKTRLDIVETISIIVGTSCNTTLSELAKKLPKESADSLLGIAFEIKSLSERLNIATERNRYILNTETELLSQILEIASGNTHEQYNSSGSTNSNQTTLHVLDHMA